MSDIDTDRRIDERLFDAGARWRSQQVFEPISMTPRLLRGRAGSFAPAVGFLSVAVALGVVFVTGLPRVPTGAAGRGSPTSPTATSHPVALSASELEAARLRLVEAVNTDPAHFGVPYLDDDGTLVVQYFDEATRAALEAEVTPGLAVRWELVTYSRAELLRIAGEILAMDLPGVVGISPGNGTVNRVIVTVGRLGSPSEVSQALAEYGSAVLVEEDLNPPMIVVPLYPTDERP
jgi:hypothetical protein